MLGKDMIRAIHVICLNKNLIIGIAAFSRLRRYVITSIKAIHGVHFLLIGLYTCHLYNEKDP